MLVLVIVLLVAAYYFFVVRNVADTQAANAIEMEQVQSDIDLQNTLKQVYEKKQRELDELGALGSLPEVAAYDNLRNELDELNTILGQTSAYDIKFATPEIDGDLIRRVVNITFTAPSYGDAFSIVDQLQNGKYRCDVTDFTVTAQLLADGSVKSVNATLKVTYFETANGATSLNGLVEKAKS